MKSRNAITLIAAALSLGACDSLYGVSRSADWNAPVEAACVRHAMETTPGVAFVDDRELQSGKGLFHPTPWISGYSYRGEPGSKVHGALEISKDHDGPYHLRHMLWQINAKPPQDEIDATRPVMRRIEAALASQCGVTVPMKETCRGVACPTLAK